MLRRIAYLLLFAIGSIALIQCNSGDSSSETAFTISGKIDGAENLEVFFDKTQLNQNANVLAQTTANSNGEFELGVTEPVETGLYRLRIGQQQGRIILKGSEKNVKVTGQLKNLSKNNFKVEGAPLTQEYNETMGKYYGRQMDLQSISKYMRNSKDPLNAVQFAMTGLQTRPQLAPLHRIAADRMKKEYPDLELTKNYEELVTKLEQQRNKKQSKGKVKVGQEAPEISMTGPNGETHSLSELEGKVVLLDFWASWCKPCRKANPHVVELYEKYKDEGFTVFSVSLDGLDSRTIQKLKQAGKDIERYRKSAKQRWIKAIEEDNLKWDNHVSDLKKWESAPAEKYGVRSIPRTYLIDREGKIASINPRYNLEEELKKLL